MQLTASQAHHTSRRMSQTMGRSSFPEMIIKKRDGSQLSAEEIHDFIDGVTSNTMQQSQIGAMLMAIWQKGMNFDETLKLTEKMMKSGEVLHWSNEWLVVDKHSTGGVGDKISLILAPALAACGCKVPMISGRGLGHTGGTLDKLESIPGFKINLTVDVVKQTLQDVGCCIIGQTETLVPADRIIYAIRDITGTVDSVPLITASIMSKKAAEGLSALVLDVKFGKAALYKDLESARCLAQSLVTVGNKLGIKTGAVLSRMDAPIGRCVGHTLEVYESLECLKGHGPDDLNNLVTTLGGCLLHMSGRSDTPEDGQKAISEVLKNKEALEKFQEMLVAQGVKAEISRSLCAENADYFQYLQRAQYHTEMNALDDGSVLGIDGKAIADVLHKLGAGRSKTEDQINHSVGAELLVDLGQQIKKGQPWIRIHHDCKQLSSKQQQDLQEALDIGSADDYRDSPRVAEFILPH
ncbi:thymidine phosphorylase isoform X1 [Tachysurus fulvidraco]|uniref:thymidine phosphorylase isoform X1 n=2 Tax=Tachysurus fulvidraco TaxID=1234273 RepID=UPI001FEEFFD8|nr:thymidine phosphorylase isoform X1 [Tachysurus fulvidraco]XP_027007521.2 thymidine phosphorylase isoform X1 [Tachysurus fulvidraco]XP_047660257.1 thymidine phosphorylase isoform X1 [Tachysurus fulvidraco]